MAGKKKVRKAQIRAEFATHILEGEFDDFLGVSGYDFSGACEDDREVAAPWIGALPRESNYQEKVKGVDRHWYLDSPLT